MARPCDGSEYHVIQGYLGVVAWGTAGCLRASFAVMTKSGRVMAEYRAIHGNCAAAHEVIAAHFQVLRGFGTLRTEN